MLGTLTKPAAGIGDASVGNRAPPHGGGGSRGVLPLGATTTAADSKRDARAAQERGDASVGNRAPPHGGGGSRGVLPLGATTTAADSSAMREQRRKGAMRASGIARRRMEEEGAEAFFLWERRRRRRIQARCASSAQKGRRYRA